jgi:N-acetylglucosaminyldiphosphoundecaprenol N-acetyl-beta-D-mannosaminyltransferase
MVGMGMPVQEHWILHNFFRLSPAVILAPGACFDYIAGVVPTPPRWMGQIGLEWLFRLASEPRRLWKRYLLEPWPVLGLVLKDFFKRPAKKN